MGAAFSLVILINFVVIVWLYVLVIHLSNVSLSNMVSDIPVMLVMGKQCSIPGREHETYLLQAWGGSDEK